MAYFVEVIEFKDEWFFKYIFQDANQINMKGAESLPKESISSLYLSSKYTSRFGWEKQMKFDYDHEVNGPKGPAGPKNVKRHGNIDLVMPDDEYFISMYRTGTTPGQESAEIPNPVEVWMVESLERTHSLSVQLGFNLTQPLYTGVSDVTFTNLITNESFASSYELSLTIDASLVDFSINGASYDGGRGWKRFPAGMNEMEIAKSFCGNFKLVDLGFAFISGSKWMGIDNSSNDWEGYSLGFTLGFNYGALLEFESRIMKWLFNSGFSGHYKQVDYRLVPTKNGLFVDPSLAKQEDTKMHKPALMYKDEEEIKEYWKRYYQLQKKKSVDSHNKLKLYYMKKGVPKVSKWASAL